MHRTGQMLRLLALLAVLAVGCDAGERIFSKADVAGIYRLLSIYGKPLPTESFPGRIRVDSGYLELSPNGDFRSAEFGEVCALGVCGQLKDEFTGQWELAGGNRLALHFGGGSDQDYRVGDGYVISTYLVGSTQREANRWVKR